MNYSMSGREEDEFYALLLAKADEARRVLNYPFSEFLDQLHRHGAYRTAASKLGRIRSDEFAELASAGRLDLSLEAQVVNTKWRACFDPALVAMAESRLREHGYAGEKSGSDLSFGQI
ncbi:hypothetical protein [Pseudoduganella sp. OTU4001]|uniref:hypothetical protein n=1 Tax=Pseudoduganella sp. OTU4001 TaxID=3043854 RepID=UPI00313BD9F6